MKFIEQKKKKGAAEARKHATADAVQIAKLAEELKNRAVSYIEKENKSQI